MGNTVWDGVPGMLLSMKENLFYQYMSIYATFIDYTNMHEKHIFRKICYT